MNWIHFFDDVSYPFLKFKQGLKNMFTFCTCTDQNKTESHSWRVCLHFAHVQNKTKQRVTHEEYVYILYMYRTKQNRESLKKSMFTFCTCTNKNKNRESHMKSTFLCCTHVHNKSEEYVYILFKNTQKSKTESHSWRDQMSSSELLPSQFVRRPSVCPSFNI